MKVNVADCIWACVSMLLLGVSFHYGYLLYGILGVYVLMVVLFMWHILSVKKRQERSVAVFGTITEYLVTKDLLKRYYPVLKYTTEGGTVISSTYKVADKEQRYSIGSEEMICYDPDEPEFFYFASRESELIKDYSRFIFFGSIPAAAVLLIILFS